MGFERRRGHGQYVITLVASSIVEFRRRASSLFNHTHLQLISKIMDGVLQYLHNLGASSKDAQLVAITTGAILVVTFLAWCFKSDPEKAVNFSVNEPEACNRDWKG